MSELLQGQLSFFDIQEQKTEEKKEYVCKPLLQQIDCKYHSGYLCDRWHGGDSYIKECKSDLIKGFACAGCCHFCSQSPQNLGKCKFECRYKK